MSSQMVVASWRQLRGRGAASAAEVATIATSVETGFGLARFAVGDHGHPQLLLPLSANDPQALGLSTAGLALRDVMLTTDQGRRRFLELTCLVEELEAVFADVVTEILDRVASGKTCVPACESAISDFMSLLSAAADEAVTTEKIVGLAGELSLLLALTKISPTAVTTWQGFDADRHDFRKGSHSIEVKTSTRVGSPLVTISSVDQLTEPAGGVLFLRHYCMEKVAAGAVTIASLASEILGSTFSPQKFREGLSALGCSDPLSPAWNQIRFELQSTATYRVNDGFPRVVASSFSGGAVPAGIDKISYRLDLSAAAEFRIPSDEEAHLLKSFLT